MSSRFTGRHMAAILVAFFFVVVAVNLAMAGYASTTFGGVVVENSYVASQHFNRWLDQAADSEALGWSAEARRSEGGRIEIDIVGPADSDVQVTAVARHPLGHQTDSTLAFIPAGPGRFLSHETLPAGRWRLRLLVVSQGQSWRAEQDLF